MRGNVKIADVAAGHDEAHRFAERLRADEALIGERVGTVPQRIRQELEERAHRVVPLVEPTCFDDPEAEMTRRCQCERPLPEGILAWIAQRNDNEDGRDHPSLNDKNQYVITS